MALEKSDNARSKVNSRSQGVHGFDVGVQVDMDDLVNSVNEVKSRQTQVLIARGEQL